MFKYRHLYKKPPLYCFLYCRCFLWFKAKQMEANSECWTENSFFVLINFHKKRLSEAVFWEQTVRRVRWEQIVRLHDIKGRADYEFFGRILTFIVIIMRIVLGLWSVAQLMLCDMNWILVILGQHITGTIWLPYTKDSHHF